MYFVMTTLIIREKLHQFIDIIEDKKAAAIYASLQRKKLIVAEREKYIRGEGKSFSWNEVKIMAINKEKRNTI